LAEQYGVMVADGVQLRIKLSHQDMANIIGSTRESVTIVLGELQAERTLRLGRQQVVLTDPQRLAQDVNARPLRLGQLGSQPSAKMRG
jgi:CRP-like cAMP-binding protein